MSRRAATSTKKTGVDKEPAHLVLLAENHAGYRNLMKLVSLVLPKGSIIGRGSTESAGAAQRRPDRPVGLSGRRDSRRPILQKGPGPCP
jgi:DNA polymerase III alpha subunit